MSTTTKPAPEIRKDPRIYVAMPAYGGIIHSPFSLSLLTLLQRPNSPVAQIEYLNGDSLVSRARNKLACFFVRGRENKDPDGTPVITHYDWLMFLDTDLIFNPDDVIRLYEKAVKRGPGIYAGAYPLKTIRPRVVFNPMPGAQPDADGLLKVREAGTGFMLIHRDVFTQMAEKFRDEIEYEADSGNLSTARQIEHDFFTVGVRKDPIFGYKRYLSEDWYFCQRWREMGGDVLMDVGISCQHIGQATYPLNMGEVLETAQIYQKTLEAQELKKAA